MQVTGWNLAELSNLSSDHIGTAVRITQSKVPPNWVKTCLWILIGRHISREDMTMFLGMTPDEYFVGTTLPVVQMGSGCVRELVAATV